MQRNTVNKDFYHYSRDERQKKDTKSGVQRTACQPSQFALETNFLNFLKILLEIIGEML